MKQRKPKLKLGYESLFLFCSIFLALTLVDISWADSGSPENTCTKTVHQKARSVFRKHGRSPKPGWCTGNVYFILRELRDYGFPLSRTTVLFVESQGGHDFRLWGSPEKKLNRFHAALEIDGLIYDVHYGERPEVLPLRNYVNSMFTRKGVDGWAGERLDTLLVKSIPGSLYLSLFREHASKGLYRHTDHIPRVTLKAFLQQKGLNTSLSQ